MTIKIELEDAVRHKWDSRELVLAEIEKEALSGVLRRITEVVPLDIRTQQNLFQFAGDTLVVAQENVKNAEMKRNRVIGRKGLKYRTHYKAIFQFKNVGSTTSREAQGLIQLHDPITVVWGYAGEIFSHPKDLSANEEIEMAMNSI